jgi:hypothetical protein
MNNDNCGDGFDAFTGNDNDTVMIMMQGVHGPWSMVRRGVCQRRFTHAKSVQTILAHAKSVQTILAHLRRGEASKNIPKREMSYRYILCYIRLEDVHMLVRRSAENTTTNLTPFAIIPPHHEASQSGGTSIQHRLSASSIVRVRDLFLALTAPPMENLDAG